MADSQVQGALVTVNARYVDMAKRDILNALSHFRDLHPGTDWYVFNDGTRRQVVTLNGTIPVAYKGSTYNIPICAYLLDTHPYFPPICYVRPTPDMVIRTSSHVDNSGKVYLPYLHEWRHPQSDLIGLFQVMAIIFGEHCPVFSRAASTPSANPYGTPYPSANHPFGMPMPSGGGMPAPSAGGYPPYPPAGGAAAGNRSSYSPYTPPSTTSTPPTPTYNYPTNPAYTTARQVGGGTIQPEHIRLSLLSAVEDKLRSKMRDSIGTIHAELQSIKKTREDLTSGQEKLKSMLSTLEREQEDLNAALVIYRDFIDATDKALAQAAEAEQFNIDDAVDTTTPLFRQLLHCYVEDSAIEDTIYYLGQSLKRGGLDLDSYLKHVRSLSRQQFILRATMQRCRRVAGLDA